RSAAGLAGHRALHRLDLIQQRLGQAYARFGPLQGHLLVAHAMGQPRLLAVVSARRHRNLPGMLEHLLDEQGLELLHDLFLGLRRSAGVAHAPLQAVQAAEIQRRGGAAVAGAGNVLYERHIVPYMISKSARKAPALFRFCNMDSRSCGVAPKAFKALTTSARFALVVTRCRLPVSERNSISVLSVTTVWPPAKGVSGWLTCELRLMTTERLP